MNPKQLIKEDDAVSPVIGVILMVAITVILAAVIASFVLGLGDQAQQATPQASFSFDYTNNTGGHDSLSVTHDGGDTIDANRINASVDGAEDSASTAMRFGSANAADGDLFPSNDVKAGSTYTVSETDFHDGSTALDGSGENLDLSESTVRVIYTDESGDSSSTLATWEAPNA